MVTLGAACGFNAGFMNPFTVGVAQGISQLPLFSGIGLRIAAWVVFLIITAWFLMKYAKKVKDNPEASVVADLEKQAAAEHRIDLSNIPVMEGKHKLVLLVIVVGFGFIIYGVFKHGWYITEIASAFLAMGIFGGLLGRMSPSDIAKEFVTGARAIAFGALVVGIARAILVTMENGLIIDTVIYGLAEAIKVFPKAISVLGMYVVQIIINFFIPSGSGQAATTMPIMAPLSDLLGITRQTAVMAYQFGDGFTNSIIPTSSVLMAYLSVANISYDRWAKWITPLMLMWIGAGGVFLIIAHMIGYGPF